MCDDIDIGDLVQIKQSVRLGCRCNTCEKFYGSFHVVVKLNRALGDIIIAHLQDNSEIHVSAHIVEIIVKRFKMLIDYEIAQAS